MKAKFARSVSVAVAATALAAAFAPAGLAAKRPIMPPSSPGGGAGCSDVYKLCVSEAL